MPPSGLAEGLIYIYGTLSVASQTFAPGVQGAVRIHATWLVYILWQVHSAKSGRTCRLLSHGVGTTVTVPGDLVYCIQEHASGLYRPHEESS